MNNHMTIIERSDAESAGSLVHRSSFPAQLRQQKITLHILLRWCSAGLMASFIMTVMAGVAFANKLATKLDWVPSLLPALLILLFIALVFFEYRYSEKRTLQSIPNEGDIRAIPPDASHCAASKKLLITWYLSGILVIWLLLACSGLPANYIASACFFSAGLFFYLFGLFLLKSLLIRKCEMSLLLNACRRDG